MAGLDNIIRQITAEAEENASALKKDAEGKAARILENAKAEAAKYMENADAETEKEAERTVARFRSQAETKSKQAFLASKQSMIASCIAKAKDMILTQDDSSYFAMITKLLTERLQAKDGVLSFAKKDMDRLPAGFADTIKEAARAKGGSLTVSDKAEDIDGGFVLSYGGIDEN